MPTGVGDAGALVLTIDGAAISLWKSYEFTSQFLAATDEWWCVLGDDLVAPDLIRRLVPGARVELSINGHTQAAGLLRRRSIRTGRSGTEIAITGSDVMWPATEATILPGTCFPETETLRELCKRLLSPFGFKFFYVDNAPNRDRMAGIVTNDTGDTAAIDAIQVTKQKPRDHETVFAYVSRVAQRFGLWVWPTVDGLGVVVARPNYTQPPRYQLRHTVEGKGNNILGGEVWWDATDQPSYIVTEATVPASEHEATVVRCVMATPYESPTLDGARVDALVDEVKDTVTIPAHGLKLSRQNAFASTCARPRYLRDKDSHNLAQLEAFTRREMSLLQRRAFGARYTISGHAIDGQVVAVDTVIDVQDDRSDLHAPMWVAGRTLRRDRSGGATTEIELLPLWALYF